MNVDETIRTRRSIRQFDRRKVSTELVEELLDLVRHTPSSMNGQPWTFVVVRDPIVKQRIAEAKNADCPTFKAAFTSDFLTQAPVVVVICVERKRSFDREKENGILAAGTLMLAATARGLGTVYLSAYRDSDDRRLQERIASFLDLPSETEPISLIPLGYPAESPDEKSLRPLAEMVRYV